MLSYEFALFLAKIMFLGMCVVIALLVFYFIKSTIKDLIEKRYNKRHPEEYAKKQMMEKIERKIYTTMWCLHRDDITHRNDIRIDCEKGSFWSALTENLANDDLIHFFVPENDDTIQFTAALIIVMTCRDRIISYKGLGSYAEFDLLQLRKLLVEELVFLCDNVILSETFIYNILSETNLLVIHLSERHDWRFAFYPDDYIDMWG